jgi:hypothetical protein
MVDRRQEAFRAGYENPLMGANEPMQRISGTISALGEELFGSDMGTPVGEKFRARQKQSKADVKRLQELRAEYPEEFGRGRLMGQDALDPYMFSLYPPYPAMGVGYGAQREMQSVMPKMLPSGQILEGELIPPQPRLPAPPMRREMAGQTNQFEQNAVSAMQRGRRGFGYGYQPPSYFEEGGQGFYPSIDDFVELDVQRNPEGYYDRMAQEQASALNRAGRNREAMHPLYGANANRPNYGEVPEGYVSPFERMAAPGMRNVGMPGPAPFAEGPAGKGYFGNMPNPGVRSDIRQEIGQGAGMPRLRYEPVGQQGGAMVPSMRGGISEMPAGAGANLPVMARGRGVVPTELQGEFSEVYGLEGPRGAAPGYSGSMDFGVTRDGMPAMAGGRGIDPRVAAAILSGAGGFAAGVSTDRRGEIGALPPFNPNIPVPRERMGFEGMYPLTRIEGATPLSGGAPGAGTAFEAPAAQKAVEAPAQRKAATKPVAARAKKQGGKAKEVPLPPRRDPQEAGFDPNLNYYVTQALDRLLGQNEAERGRMTQRDIEQYEKKYGPITYGL